MDIELLRTFMEVNRTRHFGEAAEALHLTQAAVSARIKQLESILGVSLFDRLKRDIRLTPEGHRLLRYADMLISGWRKARQDVSAGGAALQLAIGGSVRLWDVALQDWFITLRQQKPEVAIIAESHTPALLTRRLLDGLLDVAFMLEPAQLDVLQVRKVALMQLLLVSSEMDHTVEQALADGYLMVDWGLAHAVEHRRRFPDAPEPHVRIGQARLALTHLQAIGGSAYLPARMVADDIATGQLHIVEDAPMIELTAYAVYPVRSAKADLIKEILSLFEYKVDLSELREYD
jgi:DNA-binding transcriptional LysR family regulator